MSRKRTVSPAIWITVTAIIAIASAQPPQTAAKVADQPTNNALTLSCPPSTTAALLRDILDRIPKVNTNGCTIDDSIAQAAFLHSTTEITSHEWSIISFTGRCCAIASMITTSGCEVKTSIAAQGGANTITLLAPRRSDVNSDSKDVIRMRRLQSSESPSPSATETETPSASVSESPFLPLAPPSASDSESPTMSQSPQASSSDSPSVSGVPTPSSSMSTSRSITSSPSATRLPSASASITAVASISDSITDSLSTVSSRSSSESQSESSSTTDTVTASASASASTSLSAGISVSRTATESQSDTPSSTDSQSETPSSTDSSTETPSQSRRPSSSVTVSRTDSHSTSPTVSLSDSRSVSVSDTESVSISDSPSSTESTSASQTASDSNSWTPTVSISISNTESISETPSPTLSISTTATETGSISITASPTPTISITPSISVSTSLSSTPTETRTLTPSYSTSPTVTRSQSPSPSNTSCVCTCGHRVCCPGGTNFTQMNCTSSPSLTAAARYGIGAGVAAFCVVSAAVVITALWLRRRQKNLPPPGLPKHVDSAGGKLAIQSRRAQLENMRGKVMFESGAGKLGDSSAVTGRVPTKRRVNRDDSSDEDEPDVVVIDVEAEGTTPGAVGVDAPVSSQLEPVVRNGEIQSAAAQQSSCNSTISGDSRSEEDVWLDDKLGMVKPTVLVVAPAHSTFLNASKPAFEPTAAPPVRGPTVPVVASRDRDVQFADLSQEPEIQSAAPTLDRVSPASVRTDSEPGAREDAQAVQTMDTAKSNRQSPKPDAAVISAVVPTPPATVQPVGVKQPSPPPMQPSPLIDTSAMPIIRPVTPMGPPPGPPMKRPRVIRLMRPSDSTQATCPSPTGTGGSADSREREPQIFSIV